MKRAILISAGTLAGAAAVLAYQPGTLFAATPDTATAASADATTSEAAAAQTYTGDSVMTQWGAVQVEATVENGTITDVTAVAYPSGDHHSAQLSAMAVPTLEEQAVSTQSASLDGISGASYTSAAFSESLQSALVQAGLA